jgi:hypothetical protein
MSKVILSKKSIKEQEAERMNRFLSLSAEEKLAFLLKLNSYAAMMKREPLKRPQGKGLLITKKVKND